MERIVVAYDGSELSRAAFAYGVMLAEATGVRVHGVYVVEPEQTVVTEVVPATGIDTGVSTAVPVPNEHGDAEAQEKWATEAFEELGAYCERVGVTFSSEVLHGELVESLEWLCGKKDLLAIGQAGRFASGSVGSATRSFVKEAACPVLVVGGELRPVNRVLVAFDGSDVAERALTLGKGLAEQTGWPMTVACVAGRGKSLDEALELAEGLAEDAQIMALGRHRSSSEAELIEQLAKSDRFTLLVMGAYAESAVREVFFGSTTGHVIDHFDGPVVLVHG